VSTPVRAGGRPELRSVFPLPGWRSGCSTVRLSLGAESKEDGMRREREREREKKKYDKKHKETAK